MEVSLGSELGAETEVRETRGRDERFGELRRGTDSQGCLRIGPWGGGGGGGIEMFLEGVEVNSQN